jgi:ankyrin repeat protein
MGQEKKHDEAESLRQTMKAIVHSAMRHKALDACRDGDEKKLAEAIAGGVDLAAKRWGKSLLHMACAGGHIECVVLLMDSGDDPNRRGANRQTPLMEASGHGEVECIVALLEAGAQPDYRNLDGLTALAMASCVGGVEGVKVLLARGAKIDVLDRQGRSAVDHAEEHGEAQCALLLRQARAEREGSKLSKALSKKNNPSSQGRLRL